MKIAMIGQKGIATGSGGVERHVEEIAIRLVKEGHKVTVYYRSTFLSEDIKFYRGVELKKIKTINIRSLDAIVYTFKATINALNNGYDVYHYHALGPASLSFIPKLFRKKVVVTVHGLDWQRKKWGKFGKCYLKFGEFITGKLAHKVISVSNNLREYFIEKYDNRNEKNTLFIPNAVNKEDNLKPNIIKEYGLDEDNYILFLGRIVPEKGIHYLIEAYKKIECNKKLVIAGGSSFTDNYIKELELLSKQTKNIIFTGNVSGELLRELYSNCSFYVLPSDIEGMPLSLLEALSYGKYCLVSDIKENIGVINSNILGSTFKNSNIDDLRDRILDIITQNLYKGKEKERQKIIEEKYNWDNIVKDTIEVYKQ